LWLFWQWIRAKAVQKALQKRFPADRVWGIRAISVWARLHGYTPVQRLADTGSESISSGPVIQRSYSEPVGIMDWLLTNHTSDQCSGSESDAEVDVLGIDPPPRTKREYNILVKQRVKDEGSTLL
jgi:hypothetical protein